VSHIEISKSENKLGVLAYITLTYRTILSDIILVFYRFYIENRFKNMKKKTFHDRNKREKNEKHGDVFCVLISYCHYWYFVTPSLFYRGLKTVRLCKPFPP